MRPSVLFLITSFAFAQDVPVEILESKVKAIDATRDDLSLKFRNNAVKPVRAYTVVVRFTGDDGKPGFKTVQNHILGLGNAVRKEIQPGEVWFNELRSLPRSKATNQVPPFTIEIDYVLFTDGLSTGPDREKQSLRIDGMITGFAFGESAVTNPRP